MKNKKKGTIPVIVSNLILILVILLCIPLTVPRIFGIESYSVISGSMEPAIKVGSLVYVSKTDPEKIRIRDVIAFSSGNTSDVITHRVIENRTGEQLLITKGDANGKEDLAPVPYSHVVGSVRLSVPVLGVIESIISSTSGKWSLLSLIILAVVLRFLSVVLQKSEDTDITADERKKEGIKKKNSIANIMILAGVIICFAAVWKLASTQLDYKKTNSLYQNVSHDYAVCVERPDKWYHAITIDFTHLKELNPETAGWIYFENEDISYPVMYSGDDEKYLHTSVDGKKAIAGSIFMEGKNTPDFSDSHTILYGHNMRNLSMFGKLKKYYREKDYYQDHQYFQIITEDKKYRYQIFAYENVEEDDMVYTISFGSEDEYGRFLGKLSRNTPGNADVSVTASDKVITLSTCSAKGKRFVVHAVRVGEYNQKIS